MIQKLFDEGKIISGLYPIRLIYLPYQQDASDHHKALFSIPKKKVKSAVTRNAIKRKIKEAYRLHKHLLINCSDKPHFLLGYIYVSSGQTDFEVIQRQVIKGIKELNRIYTD